MNNNICCCCFFNVISAIFKSVSNDRLGQFIVKISYLGDAFNKSSSTSDYYLVMVVD